MTYFSGMWKNAQVFVAMFGMAQAKEAEQPVPASPPADDPAHEVIEAITIYYSR